MTKRRVAILFGGKSGEHEVSIVSALSVAQALDPQRYEITMIGIDKTGRWLLPDPALIAANLKTPRMIKLAQVEQSLALLPYKTNQSIQLQGGQSATHKPLDGTFDVILPILHGTNGEDGTIQGLLELAELPYVGSGVLGSAVGMDKDICKRVLRDAGIPVVPFLTWRRNNYDVAPERFLDAAEKQFGYPYFVKPANAGSSVGVGKVKSRAEATKKIKEAFDFDTKILVEQAINGRELECAVLGNHEPEASIVGEIIPTHEFYTYEAKYIDENGAILKIPAEGLSEAQIEDVRRYSVAAFTALECAGLARVDFFLDKGTGAIYLNEINTMPGFTSISMYPKLWAASGVPYPKLLDRLVDLALERHSERAKLKTTYEG
jgi:D-alanine-D-alanine ligase